MKEEKKSSKEILSELFDKFNATPPSSPSLHSGENNDIASDGERSRKKPKKKRKKEKKSKRKHRDKKSKKKKKKRHLSRSNSLNSGNTSGSDSNYKCTRKKKKIDHCIHLEFCKESNEENLRIKIEKVGINVNTLGDELRSFSEPCSDAQREVSVKIESRSKNQELSDAVGMSSDLSDSKVAAHVVLPDLIPISCKTKEQEFNVLSEDGFESKIDQSEDDLLPQVADIFVEELLESTLAAKTNSGKFVLILLLLLLNWIECYGNIRVFNVNFLIRFNRLV